MPYKFIKTPDRENPVYDKTEVVFTSTHDSLNELIEEFERFLRASGFYFKGQLDLVDREDRNEQK